MTFLWGVLMLIRLPDSPTTASFLTEEEKLIAIERLRANQTGYKNTHIDRGQIAEAFTDIKTWLLATLILAANIPNGGFTTVSRSARHSSVADSLTLHSSMAWYWKVSVSTYSTPYFSVYPVVALFSCLYCLREWPVLIH